MNLWKREYRFELAQFLVDYHSGQWSRGYKLLCKLGPRGNWSNRLVKELRDSEGYEMFVERYAAKV